MALLPLRAATHIQHVMRHICGMQCGHICSMRCMAHAVPEHAADVAAGTPQRRRGRRRCGLRRSSSAATAPCGRRSCRGAPRTMPSQRTRLATLKCWTPASAAAPPLAPGMKVKVTLPGPPHTHETGACTNYCCRVSFRRRLQGAPTLLITAVLHCSDQAPARLPPLRSLALF